MNDSTAALADLVQRGYRFAFALTHDAARAEDLLQDAWVAILRAQGPWTIDYLFRTIRSRFIDFCRRDALATFEPLDSDGPHETEIAEIAGMDDTLVCGAMGEALAKLRPQERAALYLSAVEDFTAAQIAEFFGWPRGTVLSLIHRARVKVRQFIRPTPGATT